MKTAKGMTFKTYEEFIEWAYSGHYDVAGISFYPNLNKKIDIEIEGDDCTYSSVMDCLHAHEEA